MTARSIAERVPAPVTITLASFGGLAVPLAVSAWSPLPGAVTGLALGAAGLWWLHQRGERAPVEVIVEPVAAVVAQPGEPPVVVVEAGELAAAEVSEAPVRVWPGVLPESEARPAMVPIRAGSFMMGSPKAEEGRFDREAQHPVTLTHDYWMADTPVTQAQYMTVMGNNPSYFSGEPGDGERPVEQVSWLDAVRYCNALSAWEDMEAAYVITGTRVTGNLAADGYRLPTEAEWERAARAGTKTATYEGDLRMVGTNNAPVLDTIAWYGGNSGSMHSKAVDSSGWADQQHPHERSSTQPVKGKRPNAWGLYDMLGNVWEWVGDWYDGYPAGSAIDPAGPPRSSMRAFRGGSFGDTAQWVRAAVRDGANPDLRWRDLGFRPVRPAPHRR